MSFRENNLSQTLQGTVGDPVKTNWFDNGEYFFFMFIVIFIHAWRERTHLQAGIKKSVPSKF